MLRSSVIAAVLLVCTLPIFSQTYDSAVAIGAYQFGAYDDHGFDTTNVGNLNVHFNVPVLNKSGRGLPFTYALGYDSSIWFPVTVSGGQTWAPVPNYGWGTPTSPLLGYITTQTMLGGDNNGCSYEICHNGNTMTPAKLCTVFQATSGFN